MIQSETGKFALYQHHADVALRQGDTGAWHLVNVQLLNSKLDDGVYPKDEIQIVGLAKQIPAVFESGFLMGNARTESQHTLTLAQTAVHLSSEEISHALGSNMIVVYSYSDLQS